MPQENQAASKVRVEMSQNDTLKRDMTHQAPLSPILAPDMVFTREQTSTPQIERTDCCDRS